MAFFSTANIHPLAQDVHPDQSAATLARARASAEASPAALPSEASSKDIHRAGAAEASRQAWPGLQRIPVVDAARLAPAGSRVLVLARHPHDAMPGCGGLIRMLCALGRDVQVLAVTDGGASHPAHTRLPVPLLRLGLDDGQVAAQSSHLLAMLGELVRPGDLLVAACRFDGHPDHEAAGRAAAQAASRHRASLLEMPVSMWRWARAGDARVPWERACRLPLDAAAALAKRDALQACRSRFDPDPSTGRSAIAPPGALEWLLRDEEIYFR